MTHPTVQLFVNPRAGSSSRRRVAVLRKAFEAAGAGVGVTSTGTERLMVADAVDHVCAVGGDGTLRYVADAVRRAGRPIDMSVYPAGTVNLLARECGYSAEPAVFVRRVLGGTLRRTTHVGLAGGTMIFNCASVGPDSHAVAALSPRLKQAVGRVAYLVAFLGLLPRWPRTRLQIVAGDRTESCEAVYAAKGRYFAGAWSFAPEASLDQPLWHVVALRRATRRDYLRFLWTLWRGRGHAENPNVLRFVCTDLAINGPHTLPLQADGDIVAHLPAHLTIASWTLSFA